MATRFKHDVLRVSLVPYTFVLLNWAAVTGLYRFARGFRGSWESAD